MLVVRTDRVKRRTLELGCTTMIWSMGAREMMEPLKTDQPVAVVVAVYLGPLPSIFPLWAASVAFNEDFQFILYTDQTVDRAPANLRVMRGSLSELKSKIEDAVGLKIELETPYKVCDYRPTFGEVFRREIGTARWWGVCDLDVVFGSLSEFLPPLAEPSSLGKILTRGNFSLYRNEERINSAYWRIDGGSLFSMVRSSGAPFAFDEWGGIYKLLIMDGVEIWNEEVIFDITIRRRRLQSTRTWRPASYIWSDGHLFEVDCRGSIREGLLVHLQKRNLPYFPADIEPGKIFFINHRGIFDSPPQSSTRAVSESVADSVYWLKFNLKRAVRLMQKVNDSLRQRFR